jgi:uncharacterized protein YegP (UPF0339 family)
MYFEIFKNTTLSQYWFVIKSSGNHQILATSEMYTRKESAVHTIGVIANNGAGSLYYDRTSE